MNEKKQGILDNRLLVEVLVTDRYNEYILPEQVAENMSGLSIQEIRYRLETLFEQTEYLDRREVAGHIQYGLTDEGKRHLRMKLEGQI